MLKYYQPWQISENVNDILNFSIRDLYKNNRPIGILIFYVNTSDIRKKISDVLRMKHVYSLDIKEISMLD